MAVVVRGIYLLPVDHVSEQAVSQFFHATGHRCSLHSNDHPRPLDCLGKPRDFRTIGTGRQVFFRFGWLHRWLLRFNGIRQRFHQRIGRRTNTYRLHNHRIHVDCRFYNLGIHTGSMPLAIAWNRHR